MFLLSMLARGLTSTECCIVACFNCVLLLLTVFILIIILSLGKEKMNGIVMKTTLWRC